MLQLSIARDNTSVPTYALPISDKAYTARLSADTDTSISVPTGAKYALVSSDDFFFVSESSITLPTGGAGFTETDTEIAKEILDVEGVTTLHFRSRNEHDISIAFYG